MKKYFILMVGLLLANSASAITISPTGNSIGGNPGGGALYQASITDADVGQNFYMNWAYSGNLDDVSALAKFTVLKYEQDITGDWLFDLGVSIENTSSTVISNPRLMSIAMNVNPDVSLVSLEDTSTFDDDKLTNYSENTNFPGLNTVDICVYTAGCTGGNIGTGLASSEWDEFTLHMSAADLSQGLVLSDFAAKFQGQDSYELAGYCSDCTPPPPPPPQGDTPVPATLALMGIGLLGFAASRRRKTA